MFVYCYVADCLLTWTRTTIVATCTNFFLFQFFYFYFCSFSFVAYFCVQLSHMRCTHRKYILYLSLCVCVFACCCFTFLCCNCVVLYFCTLLVNRNAINNNQITVNTKQRCVSLIWRVSMEKIVHHLNDVIWKRAIFYVNEKKITFNKVNDAEIHNSTCTTLMSHLLSVCWVFLFLYTSNVQHKTRWPHFNDSCLMCFSFYYFPLFFAIRLYSVATVLFG